VTIYSPAQEVKRVTGHALALWGGVIDSLPTPFTSSALQAVRSRERFELKYLLSREQAAALAAEVAPYMDEDSHGAGDPYAITSLYYDTPDLRCYWEKVDGLRYRRKLRIRHYEGRSELRPETTVFVEIKQRVNRTVQKRRAGFPYAVACALCEGEEIECDAARGPFVREVQAFVDTQRLQPTAITSYFRRALVGTVYDPGLRITFDTDIRYRVVDLDLASRNPGHHMLHPERVLLEVKANERIPRWLAALVGEFNARVVRISKYCQGIEAAGCAPRSVFHMPED
jgi:SPX domain protein involved in polyphosphate accumulation